VTRGKFFEDSIGGNTQTGVRIHFGVSACGFRRPQSGPFLLCETIQTQIEPVCQAGTRFKIEL